MSYKVEPGTFRYYLAPSSAVGESVTLKVLG
jgi:hypothetical protein